MTIMTTETRKNGFLRIEDLYKSYDGKVILDNVDLAVAAGEIVTLVGPSGCGKSTLLRLILGQELPTAGTITIEGRPVGFADPSRGIVYQKYSLFPHLTVLENVLLGIRMSNSFFQWRRLKKEKTAEAMTYLEKVNLADHAGKYPHELSGGMRQRVAIAQSLIMKPKILLMDEPFGALDPGTRENMQIFLIELWEEFGMTIFFVTHDLEEAVFLGTRIIVLSQYYTDDRGEAGKGLRGARVVFDRALPKEGLSTLAKTAHHFGDLIREIRHDGFDPEYIQHVKDFDLNHPDSFQTLLEEEYRTGGEG